MFRLRLITTGQSYNFVLGPRSRIFFALSLAFIFIAVIGLAVRGLNFGIDFEGGTMIDVRHRSGPVDLGSLRATLNKLDLGNVAIQTFGSPSDLLIRIRHQEGEEKSQADVVNDIRVALGDKNWEYRRVEFVGPKIGSELIRTGMIAILMSICGILIYVWFRFEWNFAVASVAALAHDILMTVGFLAWVQLEFNLWTLAAILTIAGYSINDTVVVFDRIRENLRKFKTISLQNLVNRSVNDTLARTLNTSITTLIAIGSIVIFGGPVIQGLGLTLLFGVLIGTWSSIFVASNLLLFISPHESKRQKESTV